MYTNTAKDAIKNIHTGTWKKSKISTIFFSFTHANEQRVKPYWLVVFAQKKQQLSMWSVMFSEIIWYMNFLYQHQWITRFSLDPRLGSVQICVDNERIFVDEWGAFLSTVPAVASSTPTGCCLGCGRLERRYQGLSPRPQAHCSFRQTWPRFLK